MAASCISSEADAGQTALATWMILRAKKKKRK
jgi:hypothetical protein